MKEYEIAGNQNSVTEFNDSKKKVSKFVFSSKRNMLTPKRKQRLLVDKSLKQFDWSLKSASKIPNPKNQDRRKKKTLKIKKFNFASNEAD